MPLVPGFSRGSPVSPAPSFRRRSMFTSTNLIASGDLDVKSHPNLFAHSRSHTRHGNDVTGQQNVGTPSPNQRLVTYSPLQPAAQEIGNLSQHAAANQTKNPLLEPIREFDPPKSKEPPLHLVSLKFILWGFSLCKGYSRGTMPREKLGVSRENPPADETVRPQGIVAGTPIVPSPKTTNISAVGKLEGRRIGGGGRGVWQTARGTRSAIRLRNICLVTLGSGPLNGLVRRTSKKGGRGERRDKNRGRMSSPPPPPKKPLSRDVCLNSVAVTSSTTGALGINTLSRSPGHHSSLSASLSSGRRALLSHNMKLLVVCLLSVVAVALARPQQPEPIPIVKQTADITPEGAYQYSYETGNGIKADETGSLEPADNPEDGNVVVVQGSYTYTGDDGVVYTVNYKADKNGYQASGDHIPQK
ncbi:hypothetical protein PR048_004478 [Dryococelus australis]|uniref:Uncharacterized protein n=1 Tax=Dryococelus australis TaxID=614101 RepID=A0ABQ9I5I6_9NEOP|nr:hypothetical protein PR048_004478 [Dryococelus australis]